MTNNMYDLEYDRSTYSSIVRSTGITDIELKCPLFIPLESHENVYLLLGVDVYSPFLRVGGKIKVTKEIKKLSKDSKYVLFSENRPLGTEERILTPAFHQPRTKEYQWLVAEKIGKKLYWYKYYNTSPEFKEMLVNFFTTNKDYIADTNSISETGLSIYETMYAETYKYHRNDNLEKIPSLMGVNKELETTPFLNYRVRHLLEEVSFDVV